MQHNFSITTLSEFKNFTRNIQFYFKIYCLQNYSTYRNRFSNRCTWCSSQRDRGYTDRPNRSGGRHGELHTVQLNKHNITGTTTKQRYDSFVLFDFNNKRPHGPHRSSEKPVQINKHICSKL